MYRFFLAVFDEFPSNVTCSDGDIVTFNCSVGNGDILWFVNNTFALGLPVKFNASFKTSSKNDGGVTIQGETSTLRFIAKPEANNSLVECAVGLANKIQRDPKAVANLIGKIMPGPLGNE